MERKEFENDPQELERFKQEIDLVAYAQRQGYQLKAQGKRGDWHHLVNNGEHIIISRKDQKQVYLNPGDDRDRGTIIDFVKTRENKNLGEVRLHLREYLDGTPFPRQPLETAPGPSLPGPPTDGNSRDKGVGRQEEEEIRRTRLIAEVLGVRKELRDRSYLYSRGLTDETIDSPSFQGRVFTSQQNHFRNTVFPLYNEHGLASVEQKNKDFKSLLELPKDGIWVSHPTEGKGTPVKRLVVTESAIDAMSYHQLKHDGKNTMYIATAGTVTERQIGLIQRVIDKQEPREIVLANDRDAAGRRYNINYLNDLQVARPFRSVGNQEAYGEAARPISWHATLGRYHTDLRVDFHHASAQEGTERIQPLLRQVAHLNASQGEPSIEVTIQRSTEKDTVIKLSAARADTAQLEVLSQELYRQREQLRPEAERQPTHFIRVDYPLAKDFNRDLELTNQGLSPEQIREQARVEEAERHLRERQSGTGDQKSRSQGSLPEKPQPLPSPPAKEPGSEREALVQVKEVDRGPGAKGKAEAVRDTLEASGAAVGDIHSVRREGTRFSEMTIRYRTDQEELGKISKALDAIGLQKGNTVTEHPSHRAERRELAGKSSIEKVNQQEIAR
ncbi:toprim domain-containing protein [Rufibacter immobilis]|uniref:toprim domain-containing protein n=1 Tax=Rufibacter immobilis TaxID=1348778 RepID=UPI0035EE2A28